jgi:hypothetical protein
MLPSCPNTFQEPQNAHGTDCYSKSEDMQGHVEGNFGIQGAHYDDYNPNGHYDLWAGTAQPSQKVQVLNLEHMLALDAHSAAEHREETKEPEYAYDVDDDVESCDDGPPQLGSKRLPSVGSVGHFLGRCKPCAFATRTGCANGSQCEFCHLCTKDEKKRRRKDKRSLIVAARKLGLGEGVRE